MRRIFAIALTALLFAGAVVLACFDSDPDSLLGNDTTTITGENGSSFDVAYPIIPGFNPMSGLTNGRNIRMSRRS